MRFVSLASFAWFCGRLFWKQSNRLQGAPMGDVMRTTFLNRPAAGDFPPTLWRDLMDALPVSYLAVNNRTTVSYLNAAGQPWPTVVRLHTAGGKLLGAPPLTADAARADRYSIQRRDGVQVPVQLSAAPIVSAAEEQYGVGSVLHELRHTHALIERLLHRCALGMPTGLVNRDVFEKRIARASDCARSGSATLALVVMELTDFKAITDRCGHGAGASILRQVAERFRSVVRDRDTLAWLGNDEFALLLEHCDQEHAVSAVRMVRMALRDAPVHERARDIVLGCSLGFTVIDRNSSDVRSAIAAAKCDGEGAICASTMGRGEK